MANPVSTLFTKHRRTLIIAVVVIVLLWAFSRNGGPKTSEEDLPAKYASKGRVVLVHAAKNAKKSVPLVIVLSDNNTKAKVFETDTGASKLANRKKFALVYPELLNGEWKVDANGADAQYIRDVISFMQNDWTKNIDAGRVYLWGLGEGARLALVLACANPSQFAAVGVVGQFDPQPPGCEKQVPTDRENSASWDSGLSADLWSFSSNKSRTAT